jgi:predicted peptidase
MAAGWRDLMRRRSLCGLAAGIAGGGLIPAILLRRQAAAQEPAWIEANINGLHYEVLLPEPYDAARRYPVVLYLHQLAMGTYREGLLRQVNAWFRAPAFRSRHPCIVVVPMLDQTNDPDGRLINFGGKRDGHFGEDSTIAALKQVIDRYSADPDRLYVTGNSLGGMGTWQMLLAYNVQTGGAGHLFAAGLPLAGAHRTADPDEAARILRHVPIWAIHGATDHEVSPDWDRTMAKLLSGSPTFRYTEDARLGHDVWDSYYTRTDVWDWLFAQAAKR